MRSPISPTLDKRSVIYFSSSMYTKDAKKRHLSITSMTLILLTVTLAVTIITITTSDNAFARNERYASDATSQDSGS